MGTPPKAASRTPGSGTDSDNHPTRTHRLGVGFDPCPCGPGARTGPRRGQWSPRPPGRRTTSAGFPPALSGPGTRRRGGGRPPGIQRSRRPHPVCTRPPGHRRGSQGPDPTGCTGLGTDPRHPRPGPRRRPSGPSDPPTEGADPANGRPDPAGTSGGSGYRGTGCRGMSGSRPPRWGSAGCVGRGRWGRRTPHPEPSKTSRPQPLRNHVRLRSQKGEFANAHHTTHTPLPTAKK
jgi:hypothetical protein